MVTDGTLLTRNYFKTSLVGSGSGTLQSVGNRNYNNIMYFTCMHANDFLGTYRTQATAFPVHLKIRLYDPIHKVPCTMYNVQYIQCVYRLVLQAIVLVIFRNDFAFVAADTIIYCRSETKIQTCNYHVYTFIFCKCIIYRRKHTFLSPTDTGFFTKIILQFPCIFYPLVFVTKHL